MDLNSNSNSNREAIKLECDYLVEDHCPTAQRGTLVFDMVELSCNIDVFQKVT